jgi:predicted transcriptional regulator with HTH domain
MRDYNIRELQKEEHKVQVGNACETLRKLPAYQDVISQILRDVSAARASGEGVLVGITNRESGDFAVTCGGMSESERHAFIRGLIAVMSPSEREAFIRNIVLDEINFKFKKANNHGR